mmetsp:Transcript_6376/g.17759  ORF Transcript_6376/g.17759 Transcript_6376/m.17759 type:complete len:216 (-) Transcript_6376:598-1245(-)
MWCTRGTGILYGRDATSTSVAAWHGASSFGVCGSCIHGRTTLPTTDSIIDSVGPSAPRVPCGGNCKHSSCVAQQANSHAVRQLGSGHANQDVGRPQRGPCNSADVGGESAACHGQGCAPDGLLARTDAPISLCDGCTVINCTIRPSRDRSPRSACSPKSSRDAKVDWWDHTVTQHGEALAHGLYFVAWQGAGRGGGPAVCRGESWSAGYHSPSSL